MNGSLTDDFKLFGLPISFDIDVNLLSASYLKQARTMHPDTVSIDDATSQQAAMTQLVQLNKAYERLKNPLSRAEYMLTLQGVDPKSSKALPPTFLMAQMELRESIETIKTSSEKGAVISDIQLKIMDTQQRFSTLMLSGDHVQACQQLGLWRFYDSAMKQAKHKEITV